MKFLRNKNSGFTLIEFLIYIGIVGGALVVAGAITFNIMFGKAKLGAIEEVSQNARFAMEFIAERVRNAELVNTPTVGSSGSTLSLQMADAAKNPTVFDLTSGAVRITEGAGAATAITATEVTVTDMIFTNISYVSTPGTVRVQMDLSATNPSGRQEYDFDQSFYTTANVREK
jgi:type II secretory pathway pseudopilin PulG